MCDFNKNPNFFQINHKNKSFNSFITNKIKLDISSILEDKRYVTIRLIAFKSREGPH